MELWKPIAEDHLARNYEVSSRGRVRTKLAATGRGVRRGVFVCQRTEHKGYKSVRFCVAGIKHTRKVHRLVAMAFIGPPPSNKHQVNHKNGNKTDNRAANLEWCTNKENMMHAMAHGLVPRGSQRAAARITEEDAKTIRVARAAGVPCKELAKRYGLAVVTISHIGCGYKWKHVL